jgi:hypothetical protein
MGGDDAPRDRQRDRQRRLTGQESKLKREKSSRKQKISGRERFIHYLNNSVIFILLESTNLN